MILERFKVPAKDQVYVSEAALRADGDADLRKAGPDAPRTPPKARTC